MSLCRRNPTALFMWQLMCVPRNTYLPNNKPTTSRDETVVSNRLRFSPITHHLSLVPIRPCMYSSYSSYSYSNVVLRTIHHTDTNCYTNADCHTIQHDESQEHKQPKACSSTVESKQLQY
jgi:hypothetical protein